MPSTQPAKRLHESATPPDSFPARAPKARLRASAATTDAGLDALAVLAEIAEQIRSLELQKLRLIGVAQERGASWDQIGTALDVTRQAAWEKYRERVRDVLDATATRAEDGEAETLESAANVLREIRRRRRRG
jgi:hypothetical protein